MKASLAINTAAKFIIAVAVLAVVMGLLYYYGIGETGKINAQQEARDACEKLKTSYGCSTVGIDVIAQKCFNAGYDACKRDPRSGKVSDPAGCIDTCCAIYC